MEIAGFEDLSAYLGKKDAPELATLACGPYDPEIFVASDWIDLRNWGYLNTPTIQLKEDLIKMDAEFQKFHADAPGDYAPNELSRSPNAIKDFAAILKSKFPNYPEKLIII